MPGIDLKKLNPVALTFILLSVGTIIFFIFFSIVPGQKSIEKIRRDIVTVSTEIKIIEEKVVPAYAEAKKFEKINFKPELPLPKRKKLSRENLPGLTNRFQSLALKHNVKLSGKHLDISFLKSKSNSISMFLEIEGGLQDFRQYLIAIISLPFFDSIEKIQINSTKNSIKNFSINLKITIEEKT